MRTLRVMLALALAAASGAGVARAQISPGPLARAHADLDGSTNCLKCHVRGEPMSNRCMSCHTEIAGARKARRGLHGGKATGACESCHPDHAGRDFALIQWEGGSKESFDHAQVGWALEGAHAKTACADCHKPAFQQPEAAARIRIKDRTRSYLALDTRCNTCHEDPHKNRFGTECSKCHGTASWEKVREDGFDHELTRYPLRGRHAKLECAACHDENKAWGAKPAFAACGDCHADAHAGRAQLAGRPADCAACHDVRGFTPSTMPLAEHAKTAYPLEGRHAKVACARCHPKAAPAARAGHGTAGVIMRPGYAACTSCHADAHGGQLAGKDAACGRCHDVRGFKPSRFGVAEHARSGYALTGAHADAACATCHGAARRDLPAPARAAGAGQAKFVFAIAERACADCHADVHAGSLTGAQKDDRGCAGCHDTRHFEPSAVDAAMHDRYDFRLEGAHRAVPCVACHESLETRLRGAVLKGVARKTTPITFAHEDRTCAGCHANPHGDQFAARKGGRACETCHDVEQFEPASKFEHDRDAKFKLEGVHARIACAACHRPAGRGSNASVVYRGTPTACEACHQAGTNGGSPRPDGSSSRSTGSVPAALRAAHARGGV